MATKTISIDIEAYEALVTARKEPDESFSRVIKRAKWESPKKTAGHLLERLAKCDALSKETLDYLDRAQKEDRAPKSRWK